MTSTLEPSLSTKLSLRLVDLTISFGIDQVSNKLLIHCIATCIVNDAVAGIQVPQFQAPPPLPHFGSPLRALVHFLSLVSFSSFILMFFTRCMFFIHRRLIIHSRMSLATRTEVVASTPTTQTIVTAMAWLDSSCDNYVMHECVVNFIPYLVFEF
jgi:hypothetical protein